MEKACEKVREIVNQAIEQPGGENDLRKNQLRELALLNGTLRENDSLNKLKIISHANTIVTNTIICGICGGAGHITRLVSRLKMLHFVSLSYSFSLYNNIRVIG